MVQGLDLLTYLTGEPGPDVVCPRVGDAVELRVLSGGRAIGAFSAAGQCLGRLPPAERDAFAELMPDGRLRTPAASPPWSPARACRAPDGSISGSVPGETLRLT